jgi:hypothetical protein
VLHRLRSLSEGAAIFGSCVDLLVGQRHVEPARIAGEGTFLFFGSRVGNTVICGAGQVVEVGYE